MRVAGKRLPVLPGKLPSFVVLNGSFVDYLSARLQKDLYSTLKHRVMKNTLFFLAACLLLSAFVYKSSGKSIVGHWTINYPSGQQVLLDFRSNGTFETVIPAEHFTVGGQFKFEDDILSITDTSCGTGYWAKYKTTFFIDDSVYSAAIEDSCAGRKSAMDKATLIRVRR